MTHAVEPCPAARSTVAAPCEPPPAPLDRIGSHRRHGAGTSGPPAAGRRVRARPRDVRARHRPRPRARPSSARSRPAAAVPSRASRSPSRPPDGEEVDQVESDENGRWEVELPGPGEYVVSHRRRRPARGRDAQRRGQPDGHGRRGTAPAGQPRPRGRQPRGRSGWRPRHPAVRRRPALRPADRDLRRRPVADLRHDRADQLRARRAGHDRRRRRLVHQRRRRRAADPGRAASPWSSEPPSARSTSSACGGRCAAGAPG